jgi:hypothetical protein
MIVYVGTPGPATLTAVRRPSRDPQIGADRA